MNQSDRRPPSLRRIKARAKDLKKRQGGAYTAHVEAIKSEAGFSMPDEKRSANSGCEDKKPPLRHAEGQPGRPIFSTEIGGYTWSLECGKTGPELWMRAASRLAAPCRAIQLGIFPVLMPPESEQYGHKRANWTLMRYTSYVCHILPGFDDDAAQELSRQFGIPVWRSEMRQDQQRLSERMFLQSPAFTALRSAIRESPERPKCDAWDYGLSRLWTVLVAMPDHLFDQIGCDVAGLLTDPVATRSVRVNGGFKALVEGVEGSWRTLPDQSSALEALLYKTLPLKLVRQAMRG